MYAADNLTDQLRLFTFHHQTDQFNGSITFGLELLRFLIHLSLYIPRGTRTHLHERNNWQHPTIVRGLRQAYEITNALSPKIVQDSQLQRTIFTVLRRNWMSIRYTSQLPGEEFDVDVSDEVGSRKRQKRHDQAFQQKTTPDSSLETSQRMGKLILQPTASISAGRSENKRRHTPAPANLIAQHSSDLFALTLFELTTPFMELTLHTSRPFGNVNPEWIELASELMLQSGIERLQEISGALTSAEHDRDGTKSTPNTLNDLNNGLVTWINECLAWGSIKKPSTSSANLDPEFQSHRLQMSTSQLTSHLQTEDLISAMFNSSINIAFPDDKISTMLTNISTTEEAKKHEWNQYTRLREQYLQKLLGISTDIKIASKANENANDSFVPAIKKLCEEHPIVPFLEKLHKFLTTIWRYNMHKDVSGKPVLVQIEQGGLQGLNAAEFEEFLDRCGLKMSRVGGGAAGFDGEGQGDGESTVRFRWA